MSRRNYKPWYRNPLLLLGGAIIALALVVLILELTNTTHWFHQAKTTYPNPVEPHNKSINTGPTAPNKQPQNTDTGSSSSQPSQANTATNLQAPSGSFVSNHRPTPSGQPGPTEQSICITSPGATCVITLTSAGVVKALPAKTADASGTASWSWTIQDLGITGGSWTITAKSTLGSQTKSTTDPIALEVQQ